MTAPGLAEEVLEEWVAVKEEDKGAEQYWSHDHLIDPPKSHPGRGWRWLDPESVMMGLLVQGWD